MSVPKWHFLYGSRRDRRSREILLWGEARKKNTIFNAQKMTFVLVYLVLLHLLGARVLAASTSAATKAALLSYLRTFP